MNKFAREGKSLVSVMAIFGEFEKVAEDIRMMENLLQMALLEVSEDQAFALEFGLLSYAGQLEDDASIADFRHLDGPDEVQILRAQAINRLGEETRLGRELGDYESLLTLLKLVAWYRQDYVDHELSEAERREWGQAIEDAMAEL